MEGMREEGKKREGEVVMRGPQAGRCQEPRTGIRRACFSFLLTGFFQIQLESDECCKLPQQVPAAKPFQYNLIANELLS